MSHLREIEHLIKVCYVNNTIGYCQEQQLSIGQLNSKFYLTYELRSLRSMRGVTG